MLAGAVSALGIKIAGAAALALLVPVPASAHHSVAAEFDTSQQRELEGEITHVWFSNPHVRYRLTVTSTGGTAED